MDFTDARQRAALLAYPNWPPEWGQMFVAPWGWEDAEAYWVPIGPVGFLRDGDDTQAPEDGEVYLVAKATGEVTTTTYLIDQDRLEAMTPVGEKAPGLNRFPGTSPTTIKRVPVVATVLAWQTR